MNQRTYLSTFSSGFNIGCTWKTWKPHSAVALLPRRHLVSIDLNNCHPSPVRTPNYPESVQPVFFSYTSILSIAVQVMAASRRRRRCGAGTASRRCGGARPSCRPPSRPTCSSTTTRTAPSTDRLTLSSDRALPSERSLILLTRI